MLCKDAEAKKLAIGLMSGTSADGIDAVLVEISGCSTNTHVRQMAFVTLPFTDAVRSRILQVAAGNFGGSEELCLMNFLLGKLSADACLAVCAQAGVDPRNVAFVGSHGQTVFHAPVEQDYLGYKVRGTLQIGEASMIVEALGCPVVSDFRVRDMAAGGLGAPLVPYTEYLLYQDPQRNVALQNIGGIGNITLLPRGAGLNGVLAFDTGPGNMVIDALAARMTNGKARYDDGGKMAAAAQVNPALLAWMMQDEYLKRTPPKTTGREMYGDAYVEQLLKKANELDVPLGDVLATATRFTAECIGAGVRDYCPVKPDRMIVGGGGSMNPTLLAHIADCLPGCEVMTNEQLGLDSNAKEAVAFAVLANEAMYGRPNNAPGAADTTQVAWVRLCKHIGFDGLKDMKKALFNELNETNAPTAQRESSGFFTDIRDYNTITEMADAVKTSSICAIEDTMKLLDPAIVERAAGKIIQADSVRLFGVNASSLVAQDLYYKLIRIGKSACYAQDLHIQLTYAATMGPKDVGIFVSNSGTTREVMECLHLAAARGGTTIALTRFDNSPLAQAADLCLYTSSPEISHRSGAMSSRIAQMCMVDVLFTAVARRNYRKVETALENSYKSCMTHRVEAEN